MAARTVRRQPRVIPVDPNLVETPGSVAPGPEEEMALMEMAVIAGVSPTDPRGIEGYVRSILNAPLGQALQAASK